MLDNRRNGFLVSARHEQLVESWFQNAVPLEVRKRQIVVLDAPMEADMRPATESIGGCILLRGHRHAHAGAIELLTQDGEFYTLNTAITALAASSTPVVIRLLFVKTQIQRFHFLLA